MYPTVESKTDDSSHYECMSLHESPKGMSIMFSNVSVIIVIIHTTLQFQLEVGQQLIPPLHCLLEQVRSVRCSCQTESHHLTLLYMTFSTKQYPLCAHLII